MQRQRGGAVRLHLQDARSRHDGHRASWEGVGTVMLQCRAPCQQFNRTAGRRASALRTAAPQRPQPHAHHPAAEQGRPRSGAPQARPLPRPNLQVLLRGLEGQVELEDYQAQLPRLHNRQGGCSPVSQGRGLPRRRASAGACAAWRGRGAQAKAAAEMPAGCTAPHPFTPSLPSSAASSPTQRASLPGRVAPGRCGSDANRPPPHREAWRRVAGRPGGWPPAQVAAAPWPLPAAPRPAQGTGARALGAARALAPRPLLPPLKLANGGWGRCCGGGEGPPRGNDLPRQRVPAAGLPRRRRASDGPQRSAAQRTWQPWLQNRPKAFTWNRKPGAAAWAHLLGGVGAARLAGPAALVPPRQRYWLAARQ